MAPAKSNSSNAGFTLIEVVVAMGLLTVVSLGVAQLFAASTRLNVTARSQTSTTALAEQKMEQLRSLTWGFDADGLGLPVSDTTSDIAVWPPTQAGRGLNPSPAGALESNTAGYVDFVDAGGAWVGTGAAAPAAAEYVRRWSITPLPTNPNNTLVLQVLVSPLANELARQSTGSPRIRMPGDTLLVSVRTRKAQ